MPWGSVTGSGHKQLRGHSPTLHVLLTAQRPGPLGLTFPTCRMGVADIGISVSAVSLSCMPLPVVLASSGLQEMVPW